MFKNRNNKRILSVGIVAMLVLSGIGFIMGGQADESEAMTGLDVYAELDMSIDDLYLNALNGTTAYAVAYGVYVNISPDNAEDEVQSILSTYGVSDTAGLLLGGGSVTGMINKTSAGVVTLEVYDSHYFTSFQVYLYVQDLSSSLVDPYTTDFHIPANLLYYISDSYVMEGASVIIQGGTLELESQNLYEVTTVSAGSGISVDHGLNKAMGTLTDDYATVTVDITVYDSGHSQIGSFTSTIHVVSQTPAPPVQTPVAEVVGDVDAVFYDSNDNPIVNMPQKVANGTYFNITDVVHGSWQYQIEGINGVATSVGSSSAGLTHTAQGVSGVLNTNSSTFTIEWAFLDLNESTLDTYSSVFIVVDTSSSQGDPYRNAISLPANVFSVHNDYYALLGTTVEITDESLTSGLDYVVSDVTPGYGLSIQSVSPYSLVGTLNTPGDITVTVDVVDSGDSDTDYVTIHVGQFDHADVRMISGETWSYTPSLNLNNPTYTLSGTASVWVSESSGVISGTAPSVIGVGTQYGLTITATTTSPAQTVTQTVTFTVDPVITATVTYPPGASSYDSVYGDSGTWNNVFDSNFKDGTRTIFAISGQDYGYTVGSANGSLNYTPSSVGGTITVTATSPYTYTSGATNSTTVTVNTTVQGVLSITKSADALYLVTGKTVPNSPSEAVTLTHSDLGVGTYVWSITGTNHSGVTINSSTGVLGGTPGAVGSYSVTIRCDSDVGGHTQTATTVLTVQIVSVLVFTSVPSEGTVTSQTP